MSSIAEVAAAAGVSVSTVSKVLNRRSGSIGISAATARRVVEASARLGYRPNPFAAALRGRRTGLVGVVIRDVGDPFLSLMARELTAAAHARQMELLLGHAGRDLAVAGRQIESMLGRWFDGLVLLGDLPGDDRLLTVLGDRGTPFVGVGRGSRALGPSVNLDEARATALAVGHLLGLGHTRVAFVGDLGLAGVRERHAAFRECLGRESLDWDERYLRTCENSRADGAAAATSLLALDEAPTAILCATDVLALGAIGAARRLDRRIPDDVAVAGFDDIDEAGSAVPSLTTVRQPVAAMAAAALDILRRQLDDGAGAVPAETSMLRPELVVRESTGAASDQDRGR